MNYIETVTALIEKSISEYDNHNFGQDFAETVAIYLRTQGRLRNDTLTRETAVTAATKYRHRFAILDRIMSINPSQRP